MTLRLCDTQNLVFCAFSEPPLRPFLEVFWDIGIVLLQCAKVEIGKMGKINWIKTFWCQRKDTIKRDMRRFLHHLVLTKAIFPRTILQCKRHSPFSFRLVVSFNFRRSSITIRFQMVEKPGDFATHVLLWGISAFWYLTSFKRIHNFWGKRLGFSE